MDNMIKNSNKNSERLLKSRKLLSCILLISSLTGCVALQEQVCPAFYHSDPSLWLPGEEGSIYRFANEVGEIVEYEIKSVRMNKRYSQPKSRLACNLTRHVKMISNEKLEGFEFAFRHEDDPKIESDKQYLGLTVLPIKVVGDELAKREQSFEYVLRANEWYTDNGYYSAPTSEIVNEKEYPNVLFSSGSTARYQKLGPFLMNRIVLSKGHGLVQFRFVDNSELNLVSIEP